MRHSFAIVFSVLVLFASDSQAQDFLYCPPQDMPPILKGSGMLWEPTGMGVAPVIPELDEKLAQLLTSQARLALVSRYLRGETLPSDTQAQVEQIRRAKRRINLYLAFQALKRDATTSDELNALLGTAEFQRILKAWEEYAVASNLTEEVLPCWTQIPLTSEAPDRFVNGVPFADISIKGLYNVAGYQRGVQDERTGRFGLRNISFIKPFPIPEGPHKDELMDFCILPHCGNPCVEFPVLKQDVEVPEKLPVTTFDQPEQGVVVFGKQCRASNSQIISCNGMPPATIWVRRREGPEYQLTLQTGNLEGRLVLTRGTYTWGENPVIGWTQDTPTTNTFVITGDEVSGKELKLLVINVQDAQAVTTSSAAPPPASTPQDFDLGSGGAALFLGIGAEYCWFHTSFSGVNVQDAGVADQRNMCGAVVPMIRFAPSGSGLFAAANGTVLARTWDIEFKDVWVPKIRDDEDTTDDRIEGYVGWQFGVNNMGVGPFIGYQRFCQNERYTGQGATTRGQRCYAGPMVGLEATLVGWDIEDPGVIVRLRGTYSWDAARKSWMQQTYPGINFPRIEYPDEDGWSVGLRPEADIRIAGPLYGTIALDWLSISSRRNNTFAADEKGNIVTFLFGVGVRVF